jgi:hypothetical protein
VTTVSSHASSGQRGEIVPESAQTQRRRILEGRNRFLPAARTAWILTTVAVLLLLASSALALANTAHFLRPWIFIGGLGTQILAVSWDKIRRPQINAGSDYE